MSLQKRFKARYPKANFADFKTGDFFGKPNIFFHSEAGEGTTVFDDDGKDFRSSIFFSKEMKRQLGLAPGFPLELTHNPNPKLEIPAVPFNSEADNSETLNTIKDALVQQEIYVTPSDKFKIKFRDIFTDTVITHRSSHESRRWLAGPNFEYWPQTLNFAFFCATTGCGVSRRILFEDKMRDGKNDLTDSELKIPPQVRSFFWFHVYFTVRRILFELGGPQNSLPLPGDTAFNQTENKYDIPSFERICAEFGIPPNADFRFTRGDNHGLGSVFEYFSYSGYTKTPFKYPSKETKFEDEGGRASDGNLVPYIENTERETSMNISCVLSRTASQVLAWAELINLSSPSAMRSWAPKWTSVLPFLGRKVQPLRRRDNSYPWLKMPYEILISVNLFRDFSSLFKVPKSGLI